MCDVWTPGVMGPTGVDPCGGVRLVWTRVLGSDWCGLMWWGPIGVDPCGGVRLM